MAASSPHCILIFVGNQVRHHTVANMTDASRVSIDFRAVARPRFDAAFVDSRGRPTVFRVGEYYADSKDPFVPAVYIGDATAGGGAATAAGAACNSGGRGAAAGASGGNSCGGGSAAAAAASNSGSGGGGGGGGGGGRSRNTEP